MTTTAPTDTEETSLLKIEALDATALFTEGGIDEVLAKIAEKARSCIFDADTASGRKAIGAMAYKVARSKTILEDMGKSLVAGWKAKAKKVDAERKKSRDTLDALKAEVRQPLTDWEAAEKAKEDAERLAVEIELAEEDAHAEERLRERERVVREKEEAMLAEQREREAAEREKVAAKEQAEREARIAKEATERAEIEAKQKADQLERDRVAAERKEAEETRRRVANKQHRSRIDHDAVESLVLLDYSQDVAAKLIAQISAGLVRNVTLNY